MADAEAMARFRANPDQKLPPRESKQRSAPRRRQPIRHKTDDQKLVDEYLRGCREMAIYLMNRYDPDGAHCWNCGRKPRRLDLHHVVSRARGGHHTPSNLELVCRECHQEEHGKPWPKTSSSRS